MTFINCISDGINWLVQKVFQIILTASSISSLPTLFLINNHSNNNFLYVLWLFIPIALSGLVILVFRLKENSQTSCFESEDLESLGEENNKYASIYLGYFFVGLSATTWPSVIAAMIIIFLMVYGGVSVYYNPLFKIFGYKFYNVKTKAGTSLLLITRDRIKNKAALVKCDVYKINEVTYIKFRNKVP